MTKHQEFPEPLKSSLYRYSKAVQKTPESVIVEAVEYFLSVRSAQREGVEEALLIDDQEGVHFTHATIGKWAAGLKQGKTATPTPDA